MANVKVEQWGSVPPSAAFLIKCTKEKEKLRSKLRKQLQEHMLHMLEDCLFSDVLLGINAIRHCCNQSKDPDIAKVTELPYLLHAHESVLKARTPAFLEHVKKDIDNTLGVTSYNTHLGEAELRQFLRKVYTDDDIRRHECEALRLSRTYADILRDGKNVVNKHILEADEFEKESNNSVCTENFVTPKTSPVSPEKHIDLQSMLRSELKLSNRALIVEGPLKLHSSAQDSISLSSVTPEKERKLGVFCQGDTSEGYASELDNTHDDVSNLIFSGQTVSHSAMLLNGLDVSSTSVDIDESDVLLEDSSLHIACDGSVLLPSDLDNKESSKPDDSEDTPSGSGMVRSNTFDLHTQAPLEDYIDDKGKEVDVGELEAGACGVTMRNSVIPILKDEVKVQSDRKPSTGFFLHQDYSPSPKPNLFDGYANVNQQDVFHSNHAPTHVGSVPNGNFHRLNGSMSDSGFMSYSAFSLSSDIGAPLNSVSSSLMMSSDNINSGAAGMRTGEEMATSDLERSKRLSGSMFPFYIDINNLPEASSRAVDGHSVKRRPVSMFISSDSNDFQGKEISVDAGNLMAKSLTSERDYKKLTKAVSTPHLSTMRDSSIPRRRSVRSTRPRSCYMYVDLDSVESESNPSPKSVRRAPSSISMYIDLNEDFEESSSPPSASKSCVIPDANLSDALSVKNHENGTKLLSSVFDSPQSVGIIPDQKRKLSDSFITAGDDGLYRCKYDSLPKTRGNMSDSALNHLIGADGTCQNAAITDEETSVWKQEWSKSMPRWPGSGSSDISRQVSCPGHDFVRSTAGSSDDKKRHSSLGFSVEEKKQNFVDQEVTKRNEIGKDCGLLPMSPILRRKTPQKDLPRHVPQAIAVKASTKPQDIDAMTFPRPPKDESLKSQSKVHENCVPELNPEPEGTPKKKLDMDAKVPKENNVVADISSKEKLVESTSRSESSLMTVSGDTSSSDKPSSNGHLKDRMKSPPFILPYDFEEDDAETIYSEVSDLSSSLCGMSSIASLERRWREGYNFMRDASSRGIHNAYRMLEACSKLGEDLLRMFLEEIGSDVIVETEGKSIKAHRCILAARCKYFANILGDSNIEDNTVINLQGFSYVSVHFALCHIYSGAMNLPKDSQIVELALLADILSLDTLTDVIVLHLRTHYCHFFHKPCNQCVQGVLECLPLAVSCGFTELQDKCINWLGRYFMKTWPNKAFALLPEELQELSFQSTVKNLTVESVMEMTMNCDRLITTMPHVKWSEPVFGMVTRLLQECIHFMANNFNRILCSEGFLVLGKGQSWNVSVLEDDIMAAVELMTPDVACKSCVKLGQILSLTESGTCAEYGEFTQNFVDFLHKINRHCERYLIHNANKVVHCQSWACLPPEVQKKIKDAAVIVFEFEKPTAKPPRLSSLQKKIKKQKEKDEGTIERSTYPKPVKYKSGYNSGNDVLDKTFLVQGKMEKDRKNADQRAEHASKKIVSPITEESHGNGADSRREPLDAHDEDSLKEMQELPHDHSQLSQNAYLDVSQGSSVGLLESEENHSGTPCSDNPDSLDANDEMSDSKEDIISSLVTDDGSRGDKELLESRSSKHAIVSAEKSSPVLEVKKDLPPKCHSSPSIPVSDKVPVEEKQPQRNLSEITRGKRSPVKSYVPLPKAHNQLDRDLAMSDTQCKDLVAEIDADSRMVTHCLQEAEMLEQQLSRRLQHQLQVTSGSTKQVSGSGHAAPVTRRSSRSSFLNRVQKSVSSGQVKSMVSSQGRGKSPARIAPSPSGPHVPRLLRASENPKDVKPTRKQAPGLKTSVVSSQRTFRSVDNIAVGHPQKQTVPSRRISSRSSGVIAGGSQK